MPPRAVVLKNNGLVVKALVKAIVSRRTPRLISRSGGAMVKGRRNLCDVSEKIFSDLFGSDKIVFLRVSPSFPKKRGSGNLRIQNSNQTNFLARLHYIVTFLVKNTYYEWNAVYGR